MNIKKSCGACGTKKYHEFHYCVLCINKDKLHYDTPCSLCQNLGCHFHSIEEELWKKS